MRDINEESIDVYGPCEAYPNHAVNGYEEMYPHLTAIAYGPDHAEVSQCQSFPAAISSPTPNAPHRPLRVVHVGQFMYRAGIESWLKFLIRWVDPSRIDFLRCIVTSKVVDPTVMAELGVPVEVGAAESVRRAAAGCDVMLVSGPPELADWLSEIRPPLCIFIAHGESTFTSRILNATAPVIDHVIAVSQRVQKMVCEGFQSTVIYNGVDVQHLVRSRSRQTVRESLGFEASDFVLGYVGRLSSEKRVATMIEAIADLPQRFKILIVGWGPLRQQLMDLANRIAPSRCVFVDGDKEIGDYYNAMDAFCLNSQVEGFGLVMLEAMFSGLPVICGQIGFVPECMLNRVNCIMIDGKSESIGRTVLMLEQHPSWAQGLALEGKKYAETYGHARLMASRYTEVITRLWTDRQGPRSPAKTSS